MEVTYFMQCARMEESMQSVKQQIVSVLQKVIKDLTNQEIVPALEHPSDERHGDYSSNIAFMLFANSKLIRSASSGQNSKLRSPMDLAQEIVKILNTKYIIPNTDRVEAVAPGFINFFLSKEYLIGQLSLISSKTPLRWASPNFVRYRTVPGFAGRRIMVEFTDPNPFKEFHIGHLYSNTVGEAICRLLESQSALVWRVCYQGDVGLHIAKSLYAILQISNFQFPISNLEHKSTKERAEFLGKCYAAGAKAYEEDEKAKKEVEKINKQIYDKDPKIMSLYKKGREWSLEYFDKIYKRLGTKFKKFYFESEAGDVGRKIVQNHMADVFEKSKGAVIFRGEKYARLPNGQGLHNRVFINSIGLPTYEAKDLGLAPTKYKDFSYDLSIIITANEQSNYFAVVIKALSLIEPELAKKTKHIAHGVVRLKVGRQSQALKISSRTGSVITGEWLLDEAKQRIITKYKEMDQDTAEKVAVGAVKYALLKSGIGRDIAFNFDESISLEGNSGPYLQYTYARTQSVLSKAQHVILRAKPEGSRDSSLSAQNDNRVEPEEMSLLRSLNRFPEVVGEAAEKYSPNILCNYLFDLAQKFNLFYQRIPILRPVILNEVKNPTQKKEILRSAQDDKPRKFRLSLTMAVGQILKNGLYLLGIQAPEHM